MKKWMLVCLLAALAACSGPEPAPFVSPQVSPLNSPLSTPPPLDGPDFEVSPVKVGDVRVSGRGPAKVPIVIVDVTLSAKPLGSGVIDGSGNFTVDLNEATVAGHTIGIQVVDLSGSPYQPTDEFVRQLDAKGGLGFRYYPQIGTVYASAPVSP